VEDFKLNIILIANLHRGINIKLAVSVLREEMLCARGKTTKFNPFGVDGGHPTGASQKS
jgi:hypothetical protein